MLSYAILASFLPVLAAATGVQVAAGGSVHTVTVGGVNPPATPGSSPVPRLYYQPETVNAAVGDTVHFVFLQENHTATTSSFDTPCVNSGGPNSGFKPNPSGVAGVTWDMTVNTQDPIWMYCAQTDGAHCGHGMVFAVNPPTTGDSTFVAYKQLAIKQNGTAAVAGGDALTQPGGIVGGGSSQATATVTMGSSPAVVTGTGTAADGSTCQCSCLCEPNQLPQGAGWGGFGGFAGTLPSS